MGGMGGIMGMMPGAAKIKNQMAGANIDDKALARQEAIILSMTSKIVGSTAGAIKLVDDETKELRIRAEEGKLIEGSKPRAVLDLPLNYEVTT